MNAYEYEVTHEAFGLAGEAWCLAGSVVLD